MRTQLLPEAKEAVSGAAGIDLVSRDYAGNINEKWERALAGGSARAGRVKGCEGAIGRPRWKP